MPIQHIQKHVQSQYNNIKNDVRASRKFTAIIGGIVALIGHIIIWQKISSFNFGLIVFLICVYVPIVLIYLSCNKEKATYGLSIIATIACIVNILVIFACLVWYTDTKIIGVCGADIDKDKEGCSYYTTMGVGIYLNFFVQILLLSLASLEVQRARVPPPLLRNSLQDSNEFHEHETGAVGLDNV
mmetsp:Transcript_15191/g.21204  ORF Transcript_15191/g.21204 Transcript_15191/m.21204 type:complete len:185 (-) Transcript_15191:39-593(-)